MKIEINSCSKETLDYLRAIGANNIPVEKDTMSIYVPEDHYEYMCEKIQHVIDVYQRHGVIEDIIDEETYNK